MDRGTWWAAFSPWSHKELDRTELDMTKREHRRVLICDTDLEPGNLCRCWVSPAMPSD